MDQGNLTIGRRLNICKKNLISLSGIGLETIKQTCAASVPSTPQTFT